MDNTTLVTIGKNIRILRKKVGFTQERLAERCELDHSTIGRFERGSINMSLLTLDKVAKALEANIKDLL